MIRLFDWARFVINPNDSPRNVEDFTNLRCYRLCRPITVETYRTHGIQQQPLESTYRIFRDIFADRPKKELDAAIASAIRPMRAEVDIGFDLRQMLAYAGHYFHYGSEYLQGLAVRTREPLAKQRLKTRGIPTVILLDIPVLAVDSESLEFIQEHMDHFYNGETTLFDGPGYHLDCTISFPTVPPEWIVGFSHPDPNSIPDRWTNE